MPIVIDERAPKGTIYLVGPELTRGRHEVWCHDAEDHDELIHRLAVLKGVT